MSATDDTDGGAESDGIDVLSDAAPLTLCELRRALSEQLVVAWYQPIVRLADRVPTGLELLARLDHPRHGRLMPSRFVPVMEDAGLGWALTQAVSRRGFAEWGGDRLTPLGLRLALNVPLDVLTMPDALTWLEQERKAAGLSAKRLVVELTERQPVLRREELRHALTLLQSAGYGLAIDDVGPAGRDPHGLLDLPFSMFKLDKALVQDSALCPETARYLREAVAAAHGAGMGVIAEGVEDEATWARMATLGVDEVQGFLVARPMPAGSVPEWHMAWTARHKDATSGLGRD